ncbi:MAG: LysR family transcriptional regulator [Hoeflea sp.]|uniref:LysR family transcriptional regulator n=1 Tax=Hoeflea sp. TaxID=1940281 RepID=UPI002732113C|nr:LysR family transcriptional regulator [Hoeflea sp.]MDP2118505.1 LysR family transcriptional regulator [Hoeflea sp.]
MNNLGDLEIFARVVSAGSMSAAGRELGLSPAVVSKRLRRLEDRLGTRLMQRTTRQISLTEAGQGFYERVVAILAGIEEAEAFVSRRSALARGVLKVSAPTSFGRMHIAPHINSFMQANPDLGVNLMLRDEFVDIVGDGYDLAIRIAELSDSSLVARKLAPVRRILVASPAYLERHGVPRSIDDLAKHICLAPHNNDPWKLESPGGQLIHRPVGPLQTNSSEVVREAVIGGVGIALRSTWDIGAELADGRLVQVLPAYEGSRNVAIHAVYASRRFLPAKVRLFIDYLAELYGPTPYWENPLPETPSASVTSLSGPGFRESSRTLNSGKSGGNENDHASRDAAE